MLAFITWDVDPVALNILGRDIVAWYGVLWATGVALTCLVVYKIFKAEKYPDSWFDSFSMHVIIALIIGARLGHCLAYNPDFYLSNPLELFKIWEGGLASHGGAIGMTIGVCVFSLKKTKQKVNWNHMIRCAVIGMILASIIYFVYDLYQPFETSSTGFAIIMGAIIGVCVSLIYTTRKMTIKMLDRLIVGVAIGATLIRLGNLMNSEVYGSNTTLFWGFRFVRDKAWHMPLEMGGSGAMPVHPTQLYEAGVYLLIFVLAMYLIWRTKAKEKQGLILGICLICIFGSRLIIENVKHVQESFELEMLATIGINMGQLLSLPFLIWGIWLVWNALRKKPEIKTKQQHVKTN